MSPKNGGPPLCAAGRQVPSPWCEQPARRPAHALQDLGPAPCGSALDPHEPDARHAARPAPPSPLPTPPTPPRPLMPPPPLPLSPSTLASSATLASWWCGRDHRQRKYPQWIIQDCWRTFRRCMRFFWWYSSTSSPLTPRTTSPNSGTTVSAMPTMFALLATMSAPPRSSPAL